jgi:hypothetical protein
MVDCPFLAWNVLYRTVLPKKAIIPVLRQARAGGSHDTIGSLVARYFDCVALPHAGDAALGRFRMKRPPQLAASFILGAGDDWRSRFV